MLERRISRSARVFLSTALWIAVVGGSTEAQPAIVVRDGYEAFPSVEYMGGDATQPKKMRGMLVLTDSSLALHACTDTAQCTEFRGRPLFKAEPLYVIRLASIKQVEASTTVRGQSVAGKLLWGGLASNNAEDLVGVVYETASSAEAPVFKTVKAQSAALEAKILFRLKKLGVELKRPEGDK